MGEIFSLAKFTHFYKLFQCTLKLNRLKKITKEIKRTLNEIENFKNDYFALCLRCVIFFSLKLLLGQFGIGQKVFCCFQTFSKKVCKNENRKIWNWLQNCNKLRKCELVDLFNSQIWHCSCVEFQKGQLQPKINSLFFWNFLFFGSLGVLVLNATVKHVWFNL